MISQLVLSWLMLPRVTRARVMVGVCDDGVDHDQSRGSSVRSRVNRGQHSDIILWQENYWTDTALEKNMNSKYGFTGKCQKNFFLWINHSHTYKYSATVKDDIKNYCWPQRVDSPSPTVRRGKHRKDRLWRLGINSFKKGFECCFSRQVVSLSEVLIYKIWVSYHETTCRFSRIMLLWWKIVRTVWYTS